MQGSLSPQEKDIENFFAAVKEGNIALVSTLLSQKPERAYYFNNQGQTALHIAVLSKHLSIDDTKNLIELFLPYATELVNFPDNEGNTPLHVLAKAWDETPELAEFLISKGADIYAENNKNLKPKDVAKKDSSVKKWLFGHEKEKIKFFKDVCNGYSVEVGNLLSQKAWFIKQKNETGQTALHKAVLSDKLMLQEKKAMIALLISYDADVNSQNNKNNTPLHNAAETWKKIPGLVSFLVINGANQNLTNQKSFGKFTRYMKPVELAGKGTAVAAWFEKQEKILKRQRDVEQRFFDFSRIKPDRKFAVEKLKSSYMVGYKDGDLRVDGLVGANSIDITQIKGRRLIIAEGEALREMTEGYDKNQDRYALKKVMRKKKWVNRGEDQYGYRSGYEKLHCCINNEKDGKATIVIDSEHNPAAGHAGNFRMLDIGKYGKDNKRLDNKQLVSIGVLDAIYEVTKKNQDSPSEKECEKSLAKLFLKCLKKGLPIITPQLQDAGLYYYKKQYRSDRKRVLELLNRVLILTGVKETVRRMHGSKLNLPFAIAYLQGLTLVADGYLTMRDIFAKDAPYGLPTDKGLTQWGKIPEVENKLRALNALYTEKYPYKVTREGFHQLLRGGYDDDSDSGYDTDGVGYESPSP